MQNFVRVQIMSCSSGSGSTTLQKVDERRGRTLPRPMNMESNPTMESKGQESHQPCNICNIGVLQTVNIPTSSPCNQSPQWSKLADPVIGRPRHIMNPPKAISRPSSDSTSRFGLLGTALA